MHLSQWNPFDKLSTRLDNELDINLKLSINFVLYVIILPLSRFFLTGTEKVIYFFLCLLLNIQADLQTHLLPFWLWSDNHM